MARKHERKKKQNEKTIFTGTGYLFDDALLYPGGVEDLFENSREKREGNKK